MRRHYSDLFFKCRLWFQNDPLSSRQKERKQSNSNALYVRAASYICVECLEALKGTKKVII